MNPADCFLLDLGVRRVILAAPGHGVAYVIHDRRAHSHGLEDGRTGRGVRMRPGWRELIRRFHLHTHLHQYLAAQHNFDEWPHHVLLVGDVLAASLDELP